MGGSTFQKGESSGRTVTAGDSVGGFILVRQLGVGGMGQTWEAVRRVGLEFEQRVAIKFASPEMLRGTEGRMLLAREASLAASLRHPNIAAVLDWNEERGYIVCELVEGADLRSVLRETPQGRFAPALLVHTLVHLARGLSHAHRRVLHGEPNPVVHRDMSPGNVVVDYDGNLKIVDFGIAKAASSAHLSQTIKGKLQYMAPEQTCGKAIDGRVDQYALGVMAYEAATGRRPHDGSHDGETLAKILNGNHVPVGRQAPDIPSGLAELIERMLAVRPEDRYPSMDAIIDALEPFAPRLSIHRSMAELVHRAQPQHTIIQEGNRFVSRPVGLDLPVWNTFDPHGAPDSGSRVRLPLLTSPGASGTFQDFAYTASESHDMRSNLAIPVRGAIADGATGRWLTRSRTRLFALGGGTVLLGIVAWAQLSGSRSPQSTTEVSANPGVVRSDEQAGPRPAGTAIDGLPAPAPIPSPPSPAAPTPAAPIVALVPPNNVEAEASTPPAITKRNAAGAKRRNSKQRTGASPSRASQQQAGTDPKAGTATVRVKVFPWGRVWIDGLVRGSVPPALEVKLTPGTHAIAAGRETPADVRNVTLSEGDDKSISFDLESW